MIGGTAAKLLEVRNLKTYFFNKGSTVKAVDDVSFDVSEGEIVGIVGESGCGKTTIAFSIMSLIPPSAKIVSGRVIFQGQNLLELKPNEMRKLMGSKIAMVFQDPQTFLNPVLTIGDQIGEVIRLHQGLGKKESEERVIKTLNLVRIPNASSVVEYYPNQLSGGMKQRVLIAIALACAPSLIIADEPTTALDVTVQSEILELIKSLHKELGLSMILITHNLGVVAEICDRVYVMYAGKIAEASDVYRIFEKPLHPYTRGLLSSFSSMHDGDAELTTIGGMVPDLSNPPPGCRFHPRCPYAMEICSKEEPALLQPASERTVSCFLYE